MAKSDSNSNSLRQDQPECAHAERGRVGGYTQYCVNTVCAIEVRHTRVDCCRGNLDGVESDIRPTECHRTTRANIRSHLYGGPQGWNPHSFGPNRRTERVLNPSSSPCDVVQSGQELNPDQTTFALQSKPPDVLKGVGSDVHRNRPM